MTHRFLLLALVAGSLATAGCNRSGAGAPSSGALDSLSTGDPADLLAYNAGHQMGTQFLADDSTFSYDRFREGFDAGMRGDSSEIAYALGLRAGLGLRADTLSQIDADVFLSGLREGLDGDSTRVTQAEVARAQAVFQDTVQMRQLRAEAGANPQAQAQLAQIRANGAAAQRFLAGAERRPGVRKSPSGLLYAVTTPGSGASPTDADMVRIRYKGQLADGTVFDQSPGTEAVELPVGAVVPGFAEALKAMRPGETRTVYLPPNLAYGLAGAPGPSGEGGIPPNSALQFELTLVEVVAGGGQQMGMMPPGAVPPTR